MLTVRMVDILHFPSFQPCLCMLHISLRQGPNSLIFIEAYGITGNQQGNNRLEYISNVYVC